jgi:hypothetical protein
MYACYHTLAIKDMDGMDGHTLAFAYFFTGIISMAFIYFSTMAAAYVQSVF